MEESKAKSFRCLASMESRYDAYFVSSRRSGVENVRKPSEKRELRAHFPTFRLRSLDDGFSPSLSGPLVEMTSSFGKTAPSARARSHLMDGKAPPTLDVDTAKTYFCCLWPNPLEANTEKLLINS
jgi:hypothetical protein